MTSSAARLAAMVGHGMSAPLAERLLSSPRFAARLQSAMEARLGPLPQLDQAQARVLGMDEASLLLLVRQAGAIYNARSIAAIVDGPAVRQLINLISPELRVLALRALLFSQSDATTSPEAIAASIPIAGAGCLAAWREVQPASVAARLALPVPDDVQPLEGGVAIVAFLLEN